MPESLLSFLARSTGLLYYFISHSELAACLIRDPGALSLNLS